MSTVPYSYRLLTKTGCTVLSTYVLVLAYEYKYKYCSTVATIAILVLVLVLRTVLKYRDGLVLLFDQKYRYCMLMNTVVSRDAIRLHRYEYGVLCTSYCTEYE